MKFTSILLGISTGTAFTGLAFAIVAYFGTINSPDSAIVGSEKDWWMVAVVTDLLLGAILGAVSGAIIAGLGMNSVKAALFGGVLNLLILGAFYVATDWEISSSIKFSLYFLVPIGIVNGVIVALVSAQKPLH